MEKRVCKLCNKSFSNGRALGGHMRSHMATLQPLPPPPPPPLLLPPNKSSQLITESATSSTSSSSSSDGEDNGLGYGLRENPKKSFRLVDPEFSFLVDAGSSVVQDRESETESSKNPSRRRSKRTRKSLFIDDKKLKLSKVESVVEPEQPMSSVSDTSPEEDVARSLMMLSRATWDQNEYKIHDDEYDDDGGDEEDEKSLEDSENDDEDDDLEELKIIPTRNRAKYQCGTCKKMFKSYQALGGHRASHKKIKACFTTPTVGVAAAAAVRNEVGSSSRGGAETGAGAMGIVPYQRIHECPICFRVFKSGQALGGHKRSHITGSATPITHHHNTNSVRFRDNLIDLNLPAPMDDDDYSQVELSAVSDAEFIK